ncbi:MAG: hypothetical protein E5W72_06445 [Mesorhizobium sp.]|nr:hypothetical protein EOC94_26165 [Mesorhizobium sp. M6A.T.Ce.TU.016.01.1.1]RWA61607.1 MAG: hypothetical protein EOQ29_31500 [Mesorhizobium sp.]RWB15412.1 MAG: hypothetical protein EOQ40_28750 [Mesorhizobium sp.]RWN28050.1 MAG: hypothetical protein EOR96_33120 [Mesorhizobium sp.]RWQ62870.1 MAG: hypothetical protein EOS86_27915 [Mesorhizobium sp.]
MPRRKQARRTSVRDTLRLTHKQGSLVGEVAEQLMFGKTSVSTYFCGRWRRAVVLALHAALTTMRC